MLFSKNNSLESRLANLLIFYASTVLTLVVVIFKLANWSVWFEVIVFGLFSLVLVLLSVKAYENVISSLDKAVSHVDAIRTENYNVFSKSSFKSGRVAELHAQLRNLSLSLAKSRMLYSQQAFLIYRLIDQLNTPILVFNQKERLSYANDAFSLLYDDVWQVFRNATAKKLGLEKYGNSWRMVRSPDDWHINHSVFIDNGESYQLMVFTNIELQITESQLIAWQKIVRVIGHEINNSLTPVSSLAESLMDSTDVEQDRQALALISERCMHLQEFISKFSIVTKPFHLDFQIVKVASLIERIKCLYPQLNFTTKLDVNLIWADQTLIEQVIINLAKNSVEAGAQHIRFEVKNKNDKVILKLIDDGEGVANTENLFVPLFTTKPEGNGLGLSFCRKVIIRHGGNITLENNIDRGMSAIFTLPYRNAKLEIQNRTSRFQYRTMSTR